MDGLGDLPRLVYVIRGQRDDEGDAGSGWRAAAAVVNLGPEATVAETSPDEPHAASLRQVANK